MGKKAKHHKLSSYERAVQEAEKARRYEAQYEAQMERITAKKEESGEYWCLTRRNDVFSMNAEEFERLCTLERMYEDMPGYGDYWIHSKEVDRLIERSNQPKQG